MSARHWPATNVPEGSQAGNTPAEFSAYADARAVSSAIARACASALTNAATNSPNRMYAFRSLTGSIPRTDHQKLIQAPTLAKANAIKKDTTDASSSTHAESVNRGVYSQSIEQSQDRQHALDADVEEDIASDSSDSSIYNVYSNIYIGYTHIISYRCYQINRQVSQNGVVAGSLFRAGIPSLIVNYEEAQSGG
jgi:hypothetical protein